VGDRSASGQPDGDRYPENSNWLKCNNVLFLHLQRSLDNEHVEVSTKEGSVSRLSENNVPRYERECMIVDRGVL
jgi:hypothetical protein